MSFTKHNKLEIPIVGTKNWDAIVCENYGLIEQGNTMKAVAGLTMLAHEVGYLDTNQQWNKAIADATPIESRWLGFFTSNISQDTEGYVRHSGHQKNINWNFTPGPVYLSSTIAGAVTQIEPSVSIIVGFAIQTNEILIKPWSIPPDLDAGTVIAGEGHITILPGNYDSIIQGSWLYSNDISQDFNTRYRNTGVADGDGLRYKVFMDAGTYTWKINYTEYTDRGIVELLIDGSPKGTIDMYDTAIGHGIIKSVSGIVVASAGLKDVDLVINGKNGSSTSYFFLVSTVVLYRTA